MGVPYNHLLFTDHREPLVDIALQILIVTLDVDSSNSEAEAEDVSFYPYVSPYQQLGLL